MFRLTGKARLNMRRASFPLLALTALVFVACGPVEQVYQEQPDELEDSSGNERESGTLVLEALEAADAPAADGAGPAQAYPVDGTGAADGYPAPFELIPAPTVAAYPALEESRPEESEWFRFDLPLEPGDTVVSGRARPNLSLAIVDVTFAGIVLGSGVSDENGLFAITVSSIPEGHRIGIALAELEGGVSFEEKAAELYPYRGPGYMSIPDVGVFFETVMSES